MSLVQFCSPFLAAPNSEENAVNWFPSLDVAEDALQFSVEVEVPGVKKEDIHIFFDNGVLTIEGERKNESETKERNYHRIERSFGKFVRHLKLGQSIDANAIKASFKDGVLTVTVPKVERAKPKSIDITIEKE